MTVATTRLNQIIALLKGAKTAAQEKITKLHHAVQRAELLRGQTRTYQARAEDGERLPGESQVLQLRADKVLADAAEVWARVWDLSATLDEGNTRATADVMIDGKPLLKGLPAQTLLTLEKQLVDVRTFFTKLPVLDPAYEWSYSEGVAAYTTRPIETVRTKKVPQRFVKAEATDKHPAQVEVYHEDVPVGVWTTIHQSGALPQQRVSQLVARADALIAAVKLAREAANMVEVQDQQIGKPLMDYLLAP